MFVCVHTNAQWRFPKHATNAAPRETCFICTIIYELRVVTASSGKFKETFSSCKSCVQLTSRDPAAWVCYQLPTDLFAASQVQSLSEIRSFVYFTLGAKCHEQWFKCKLSHGSNKAFSFGLFVILKALKRQILKVLDEFQIRRLWWWTLPPSYC